MINKLPISINVWKLNTVIKFTAMIYFFFLPHLQLLRLKLLSCTGSSHLVAISLDMRRW